MAAPLDLLPYQRTIISECLDPSSSDLVILARGLGLRKLVCSLLRIYDNSKSLVLLINCDADEDTAIGEQLGVMGARHPGLRILDYEMNSKDRTELYNRGGLVSVTSRILVVDMLKKDIPTEKITGIVVLHAERCSPLSLEAFIVRLYRDSNTEGFIKAFSDQPEQFTFGMSPLKTIMKELHLRKVHIFPRFHEEVNASLQRRRADVIEIFPRITPAMEEIHISLVQCMTATLQEIKRANSALDLDDINVESAYFRHFDALVRRSLAPVWHRVRPATKQLVNDLGTLRSLLVSLLSYDCVALHAYLETIVAANSEKSKTGAGGVKRANQSPWLYTDAANVLLTSARRRCYVNVAPEHQARARAGAQMDEEWALLDEMEGRTDTDRGKEKGARPNWLPHNMEPVLEELPKWGVLADVLKEIDETIIANSMRHSPGTNTTLVMVSDNRSATLIREYLSSMQTHPDAPGRAMLENRLKGYVYWKRELAESKPNAKQPETNNNQNPVSEAMKKKDAARAELANRRRRVRGGGTTEATATRSVKVEEDGAIPGQGVIATEADEIAEFLATQQGLDSAGSMLATAQALDGLLAVEPEQIQDEEDYGLLEDEQVVLVRTYGDDGDDQLLAEVRPRYIVMMEPNMDFVRRIEVYRSSSPGLAVRVYFVTYSKTVEEHKFLAGQRREKNAFESLIKEKGSMVLTLEDPRRGLGPSDSIIRTISSRIAGGGIREINSEPPRVVVDMREFRSTLPSILHLAQIQVVPATLTVGDYVLTPGIVVERKSVPDLISSFNSGRLYTQCEMMTAHYKQPVLLIEFEENKSFSLEAFQDPRPAARKRDKSDKDATDSSLYEIQSKLVLLTLAFPQLRVIWSSSPYATADIFADFKNRNREPDPALAISIGAEGTAEGDEAVNQLAEEMLRALPGVSQTNYRTIMNHVGTVREFCELGLGEMQKLMGDEPVGWSMAPASLESGVTLHKGTKVGSGGFSIVYHATEINTGRAVALKKSRVSLRVNRSPLQHEARVLKLLSGHTTIPEVYSYGRMDHFEFLSMELLHRSLGNIVDEEEPLPLAVVLDVADQMLSALQHIQSHGLVHRDIKPDNIMLRSPGSSQICLIDFGLTYRLPKPLPAASRPSAPQGCYSVFGTLPYASLNAHLGRRLAYRDDLESLAYTLLFLLRGNLPWTDYANHGTPVGRLRQVYAQKKTYDGTRLAAGLGAGFGEFVDYARCLPEEGIPEYAMCGGILKRGAPSGRITTPEEKPAAQASPSGPLAPVKVGQVVLTRLLTSVIAERYSAQAGHWCSYIHDPCFDTPEWSTPARPSVVVRVEWDGPKNMYSITVVALAQRRAEIETADIPMVWISSSTSPSDSPQAVVVGEPKWPLESTVCYAFKRPMKFYCLPSQTPVPSNWTIEGTDIDTIIETVTPPRVPYQPGPRDSESADADTRYDARMRTGYVKLYVELLPLTYAQISDNSIDWTSERAWFDECVKASRHQDLNCGCWWASAEFSKTWREPEGWISSSYRGSDFELWDPQQERDKSLTLATSSEHEREGSDDVLDGLGVIVAVEEQR